MNLKISVREIQKKICSKNADFHKKPQPLSYIVFDKKRRFFVKIKTPQLWVIAAFLKGVKNDKKT